MTWPAFAWYAPGGQLMHEVRPMPFVYEPAAQALQAAVPFAKVPAGHVDAE